MKIDTALIFLPDMKRHLANRVKQQAWLCPKVTKYADNTCKAHQMMLAFYPKNIKSGAFGFRKLQQTFFTFFQDQKRKQSHIN